MLKGIRCFKWFKMMPVAERGFFNNDGYLPPLMDALDRDHKP
jgi:hypothetical protein